MARRFYIVLLLILQVSTPLILLAWENTSAHPEINAVAFKDFLSRYGTGKKYEHSPVDVNAIYTPSQDGATRSNFTVNPCVTPFTLQDMLARGGYTADTPSVFQALRHFYDPFALNKYHLACLTDIVGYVDTINPYIDARTWALSHPENPWTLAHGVGYYKMAMETTDTIEREANLVKSFRALGETMHLLADMTQPAHVRNDGHPNLDTDPIENTVNGAIVDDTADGPLDADISLGNISTPESLFHTVATFTNTHFYSDDTITDIASGIKPYNNEAEYPHPSFAELTWDEKHGAATRKFTIGDVPLIESSLGGALFGTNAGWLGTHPFTVSTRFARAQASVLIPIAKQANARLIDMFFPTFELTITGHMTTDNSGQPVVIINGHMDHFTDNDPLWVNHTIAYSGPGQLMRHDLIAKGKDLPVAEVTFDKGKVVKNVELPAAQATNCQLYLQVQAGGRCFTSQPIAFGARLTPVEQTVGIDSQAQWEITPSTTCKQVKYFWEFCDGSQLEETTATRMTHAFRKAGKYSVNVTVRDGETGAEMAHEKATVSVQASLNISPQQVTMKAGATQQFTVTAGGLPSNQVTWSASSGSITPNGMFTAPAQGECQITATAVDDPSVQSTATVTIDGEVSDPVKRLQNTTRITMGLSVRMELSGGGGFPSSFGNSNVDEEMTPFTIEWNGNSFTAKRVTKETTATIVGIFAADGESLTNFQYTYEWRNQYNNGRQSHRGSITLTNIPRIKYDILGRLFGMNGTAIRQHVASLEYTETSPSGDTGFDTYTLKTINWENGDITPELMIYFTVD